MAGSIQPEDQLQGSDRVEARPCGHDARAADVPAFAVPYLTPNAGIACCACKQLGRPLWWGICAWCGVEEEDLEAE